MPKYILAHDIGTSGNKASLYTTDGDLVFSSASSYETTYRHGNWAEQDPHDWWEAICRSTRKAVENIDTREIICISLSGQMMGCVCVDENGAPLRNSIIHSDQRAVEENERVLDRMDQQTFYRITGHKASANYPLQKLMWVKHHEPEIYKRTYKMLNAKDYIAFKLTGKMATDYTDASSTNLFDLNTRQWSGTLIDLAGIDGNKLPDVSASTTVLGEITSRAAEETGLRANIPVVIGAGDGMCATVGAGCITPGSAYNYIGSSSWITMTADKPVYDEQMRLETWVHPVPGYFNVGGTMQTAGACYNWLKNEICTSEVKEAGESGISPYDIMNDLIQQSPPGAGGILFLPYLLGERVPYWNPNAKGAFIGIDLSHKRRDILRSVLEGISYNLNSILNLFREHLELDSMVLIGGGAKGDVWSQILADIYNVTIKKPKYLEEATSMGAAVIGGVGVGAFKSFDVIHQFNTIRSEQSPNPANRAVYEKTYEIFTHAYRALCPIYEELKDLR